MPDRPNPAPRSEVNKSLLTMYRIQEAKAFCRENGIYEALGLTLERDKKAARLYTAYRRTNLEVYSINDRFRFGVRRLVAKYLSPWLEQNQKTQEQLEGLIEEHKGLYPDAPDRPNHIQIGINGLLTQAEIAPPIIMISRRDRAKTFMRLGEEWRSRLEESN